MKKIPSELFTIIRDDIKIYQNKNGYRFSLDPILLSDFVNLKKNENILDIGTGVGIIPILLAKQKNAQNITAVEIQKNLYQIAKKNLLENKLTLKIKLLNQDFKNFKTEKKFDLIISNPPYIKKNAGRINPNKEKAICKHEISLKLEEIIKISQKISKTNANLCLIYTTKRLEELFLLLNKYNFTPKILRLIHTKPNLDSKLFLINAAFRGNKGLKILPPLYIYMKKIKNILKSF